MLYDREVLMLSTSGFVMPLLRLKKLKSSWPAVNTEPGFFFEYKAPMLSDHWIHTQLSTPNELVYEMLGIRESGKGLVHKLKKEIIERLVIAHCNLHSDHSNGYLLKLKKKDRKSVLYSRVQDRHEALVAHEIAENKMASIARKFGCYAVKSKSRHNIYGGGFHIGGTLPMSENPQSELSTNLVGNPKGWSNVHVVDSSVFPSLPATTLGLVAMANAYRIGSEAELA